jgi:hypothetical protein
VNASESLHDSMPKESVSVNCGSGVEDVDFESDSNTECSNQSEDDEDGSLEDLECSVEGNEEKQFSQKCKSVPIFIYQVTSAEGEE